MESKETGKLQGLIKMFSGRNTLIYVFAVMLFFGIALRIHNLGKYGFWTDELFHVISANSLLEVGAPVVPGMAVYNRAYPFTKLISISFKYFGTNEIAGRIPSVIFNLLFIIIGYFSIRYLFNEYLAVLFSIVMILSPIEIIWARECRMYALFQLMYFSGSVLFIIGFEPGIFRNKFDRYRVLPNIEKILDINLPLLTLSAFLLYLTIKIHPLVYNFVFVILSYCIAMTAIRLIRREGNSLIISKYTLCLMLFAGGFLSAMFISPSIVSNLFDKINGKPFWDTRDMDYVYYVKYFFQNYPAFVVMYPAGVYFMARKYRKTGIFMVCSFLPLMLMHCFLFVNNIDERYIFYIFPYFILCSLSVIEFIFSICVKKIQDSLRAGKYQLSAVSIAILVVTVGIAGYPWVGQAAAIPYHAVFDDWKSVEKDLKIISDKGIIVSTRRMPLYYYMGRNPDYVIIKEFETLVRKEQNMNKLPKPLYLDVNWIFNKKEFNDLVGTSDNVYFVVDKSSYNNPAFLDNDLRYFIKEEGVPVQHHGDNKIIIYKMKKSKI